ncbi:hypothetical protein ACXM5X_34320, partial [Pseudomonas saponiphila]
MMLNRLFKKSIKKLHILKQRILRVNVILTDDIELNVIKNLKNVKVMEGALIIGQVDIGEYTYIGRYSELCECKVGRYCSIANWVSIGVGEHDLGAISTNSLFMKDPAKDLVSDGVVIEDDVWIGTKVTVLRGVKIGRGSVIG